VGRYCDIFVEKEVPTISVDSFVGEVLGHHRDLGNLLRRRIGNNAIIYEEVVNLT